jgi:molecular chaperone DnaJ
VESTDGRAGDLYALLGVSASASGEEITRAYRRRLRALHPDTAAADASLERFQQVRAAYEVLGDEDRRRAYDQARAQAARRTAGRVAAARTRVPVHHGGVPLPGDRQAAAASGRAPRWGTDLAAELRLGLAQAVRGGVVDLVVDDPCGPGPRTVRARIPAGVQDGQTVRLAGQGEPGRHGGPPGDLRVQVRVVPHPVLRRDGADLTATVPVTFPEAALGASVPVPTLDGVVEVAVPPGTTSGTALRVPGLGVPAAPGRAAGDLVVTLEVDVPQRVTDAQRVALEQLAATLDDPRRRADR